MKLFLSLFHLALAALPAASAVHGEQRDLDDIPVERNLQTTIGTVSKADVMSAKVVVEARSDFFNCPHYVTITNLAVGTAATSVQIDLCDVDIDLSGFQELPDGTILVDNAFTYASLLFSLMCPSAGDCTITLPTGGGRRRHRRRQLSNKGKGGDGDNCICPVLCFSGHSKIDTKDRGTILMKDLKVGDKVLAADGSFQPVYSFMHYHQTKPTEFLQIHLAQDPKAKDNLEITEDHMLFMAGQENPVPASQVKVGDKLVLAQDKVPVTVSKIKKITRDGLFAPVTPDGTLVVNGLKASAFVTFQDTESLVIGGYKVMSYQLLEHMWEMPHRLYCSGVGGSDYCTSETYDEDGYNGWSFIGIRILRGAEDLNVLIQVIMFTVAMAILGPLYAMEWMVMKAPGALAASMTFLAAWYYLKKHFTTNVKALKTVE